MNFDISTRKIRLSDIRHNIIELVDEFNVMKNAVVTLCVIGVAIKEVSDFVTLALLTLVLFPTSFNDVINFIGNDFRT